MMSIFFTQVDFSRLRSDFFATLFFPQNRKFPKKKSFRFSRLMSRISDFSLEVEVGFSKKQSFWGIPFGLWRKPSGARWLRADAPSLAARPEEVPVTSLTYSYIETIPGFLTSWRENKWRESRISPWSLFENFGRWFSWS